MTATQIQEALLQAPLDERVRLAARLIAQFLADEDAELNAETTECRDTSIDRLETEPTG